MTFVQNDLLGHRSRRRPEFEWDLGWRERTLGPIDQLGPCQIVNGDAYTSGLNVTSGLLEVDSRVEGVHQSDGVELGLDALQEGSEEGGGGNDWQVSSYQKTLGRLAYRTRS
jgi:hypothetical protein